MRDGGHGSLSVAAMAVFADYGSRALTPERFSNYFRIDHICDARLPGLGGRRSHYLRGCSIAFTLGFYSSRTRIGQQRFPLVLASSRAQPEAQSSIAQFWISVPVFILTEANLGILGLGVAEPLPSWGSLLRELEGFSTISGQAWQFVPLILFILVVSSFHLVLTKEELAV